MPEADLHEVVGGLYRVFARYKLPAHVTGCPHCTSQADDDRLHRRPLKQLTAEDLERLAFKAMTTLGGVNDFKHFLPRLFEIVIKPEGFAVTDPEIVFGKLNYGEWHRWPAEEQAAVRAFLDAVWLDTLTSDPLHRSAAVMLCCIGNAADDLRPFLNRWQEMETPAAALQLAAFLDDNLTALLKRGQLSNAFWSDRSRQIQQVVDWLVSDRIGQYLENAFFASENPAINECLSVAAEQWKLLHQVAANRA